MPADDGCEEIPGTGHIIKTCGIPRNLPALVHLLLQFAPKIQKERIEIAETINFGAGEIYFLCYFKVPLKTSSKQIFSHNKNNRVQGNA